MRRPLTPAAARAGRLGLTAAALLAIALSAGGCVTGGDGRMNAMAQSGSGAAIAAKESPQTKVEAMISGQRPIAATMRA